MKYLEDPSNCYRTLVAKYVEFLKSSTVVDRNEQKIAEDESRAAEEVLRKQIEAERKAADEALKKQERESSFASAKAELETSIESFKGLALGLKASVVDSSDFVKKQELQRVDSEFTSLKELLTKLAGVDQSQDITAVQKKFVDDAEKSYLDFHAAVVKDLKDPTPPTSGGSVTKDSSTKKEAVKLPRFVGDEKSFPSPFLTFPVWLKQWKSMIVDYSEKQ